MGFYSPSQLIQDAERHGIEIRPIDVRISQWDHTLERRSSTTTNADSHRWALRLGLRLVKGAVQLNELSEDSHVIVTNTQVSTQYESVSPADFASPELTMPVGELTTPADLAQPEHDSQAPEGSDLSSETSTYPGDEQDN